MKFFTSNLKKKQKIDIMSFDDEIASNTLPIHR